MKKINEKSSVWYEKYKPQCIADLILPEELKNKLQVMVDKKDLPNLGLFSSNPGTGKSSTCNAILSELNTECTWINGSLNAGIDVLRGQIQKFASTGSLDDELKYVVMDEADYLNPNSTQPAFRGFLDEFSSNCRFIFTGNYKDKLIEPLISRLQCIDYDSFKKEEMIKPIFERLKFILENEGIEYDPKDLVPVINTFYPSIRNMIGTLQKCSGTGTLKLEDLDDANVYDTVMKVVTPSTYLDMIAEVNKLNAPDNMYSYLYKNAAKYFSPAAYPKVIVTIAKYQHMSSTVRDKNLNLCAALTELVSLRS
jgi:DNA polymerase III delta prime subunit